MRIAVIAGLLIAVSPVARADERSTTMSVGVVFGVRSLATNTRDVPFEPDERPAEGFGGARLTLGWEHGSLPYPAEPGYRVDGQLVPELIAGVYLDDVKGEGMIGVGLRGELRVSQKQQGLLRVSMRAVFYLAARALVIGEARDPLGEVVVGEYFLLGKSTRIGLEGGVNVRRESTYNASGPGAVGQLYLGWSL